MSRPLDSFDRAHCDWIEFYVRTNDDMPKSAIVPIRFKQPIKLYDDEPHSPYRKAVARASRIAKREIGLHPCSQVVCEPHDWSDGIEQFSEAAWAKQPHYVADQVPA